MPGLAPRYVDAHFHADVLARHEPKAAALYREMGIVGLASAHDSAGYGRTREIMAGAGPLFVSFGIHPQLPVMDESGRLEELAASGGIDAIGECGFDFYGDTPERVRNGPNERAQRGAFEFQLSLAIRHRLPMVLHLRKATDLLFEYAQDLARLPALVLHSWNGPPNEAAALLGRCPAALFSFGTSILNGNKKSRACAAGLPLEALLTETDAPFQPPREAPLPGARLSRAYSSFEDLPRIVAEIAGLRSMPTEAVREAFRRNFLGVFRATTDPSGIPEARP